MSSAIAWYRRNRDPITQWAYWVAVAAVFAVFLAVCLHAIAGPWRWGHNGFNGASYAQAARNSLRFGVMAQAKYHTGLEEPAVAVYFTHHPMMIHFHLVAAFKLLGVSELVGRLVPAIYSFLGLVMLFVLVKRYYGRAMALGSIIAYALIPLNSIYANMIDHEQGSIFWSLFMIYVYARWKETKRWSFFLLVMIGTSISVQFGWPGYFIALVLVIHAFLSGTRKQTRVFQWQPEYTFAIVYSVVVLGNAYLFYDFIVDLRGDFSEMEGAFSLRTSSPEGYWGLLWERSLDLQGPIFLALLGAWLVYFAIRVARWDVHYGDLVPFGFFFAQFVQSLLFKQAGAIHAYWTYHAGPTLAVGGAALVLGAAKVAPRAVNEIASGLRRLFRVPGDAGVARVLGLALAVVIVAVPLLAQARFARQQFWWGYDNGAASYEVHYNDQYLDIRWVQDFAREFNRSNADFVISPRSSWRIEWLYYLDAPYRLSTSTRLRASDGRKLVYLYDLNAVPDRRRVTRLVDGHRTLVYDRRFVLIDATDNSDTFEAFVSVEQDPPLGWHWLVGPYHYPIEWVPDPEPAAARALFESTVQVVSEAEFGGRGGAATEWDCPPGQVLGGLTVVSLNTWTEYVGRVAPICRPLDRPAGLAGAEDAPGAHDVHTTAPGFGIPAGDLRTTRLECGPEQAMVGIHGRAGQLPDALGIICADVSVAADLERPGEVVLTVGEPERSELVGGAGGEEFAHDCPEGSLAYGFRGRVGLITDAVGISCAAINRGFWALEPLESATNDDPGPIEPGPIDPRENPRAVAIEGAARAGQLRHPSAANLEPGDGPPPEMDEEVAPDDDPEPDPEPNPEPAPQPDPSDPSPENDEGI